MECKFNTKCEQCGDYYEANRTTSKYCGDKCRKLAFQKDKVSVPENENPRNCQEIRANTIPGFVYIIQSGDSDYYKIGCTASRPIARVRNLQTGSPVELRLFEVFYSMDMASMERKGQDKFKGKHVRGEWYELTLDEVERLAAYLAEDDMYHYYEEHEQIVAKQTHLRVSSQLADYEYNDVLPVELPEGTACVFG